MRYHYSIFRIVKSRTLTTPNAGQDMEQKELSFIASGNAKWCTLEAGWQFLTK